MPSNSDEIPLSWRLGIGLGSVLIAGGLSEAVVRLVDGNALPNLHLYDDDGVRIGLAAHTCQDVHRPFGGVYELCTAERNTRVAKAADPRRILVGDSQVIGLGVGEEETAAARLGVLGLGAPGWAPVDEAGALGAPERVVFVVNMANDWDEVAPINERFAVVGGWLLTKDAAAGPAAAFWGSPLSRVHLLYHLMVLFGRDMTGVLRGGTVAAWLTAPESAATTSAALAAPIVAWAGAHPAVTTAVAFLPVDLAVDPRRVSVSPLAGVEPAAAGHAADVLRDQLGAALGGVPLLDLGPALRGHPEAFLDHDLHLSADGQGRVADVLRPVLAP